MDDGVAHTHADAGSTPVAATLFPQARARTTYLGVKIIVAAMLGASAGIVGALAGCKVNDAMREQFAAIKRAACIQQLGACGRKTVYWNRCTRKIEVVDEDGEVRESLMKTWTIASREAARPGVEQRASSASGAHVDAPKMTKAYRCKKREGTMHCHLYNAAASTFGAFVKPNRGDAGWEHDRFRFEPTLCRPRVVEV